MEKPLDPQLMDKILWRSQDHEHQDEHQHTPKTPNPANESIKDPWRSLFTEKTKGGNKTIVAREQLTDLVIAVHQLYPKVATRNPYGRLLKKYLDYGERYYQLIRLLVHCFTCLYHPFRYCQRGYYLSEKEDVLSALNLLKSDLIELLSLQRSARESYNILHKNYGHQVFTRKEASEATGYSKTHMQRLLNHLLQMKLLDREGHGNRGYSYVLKSMQ